MQADTLRRALQELRLWKKGSRRAPHKPLLLLYAMARIQRGEARLINYAEAKETLNNLLTEFGPSNASTMRYPFLRLANDGLWQVQADTPLLTNADYSDASLAAVHATGGFPKPIDSLLRRDFKLLQELAASVLTEHFPASVHEDIAAHIGLTLDDLPTGIADSPLRRVRDPRFRTQVLQAYRYACAVCGFGVRLAHAPVALEAAHIQWHQFNGPDIPRNGLALCSMHHKLFDRGVFSLTANLTIQVAEAANGPGLEDWLLRYDNQPLQQPVHSDYYPQGSYIDWHVREVFRDRVGS